MKQFFLRILKWNLKQLAVVTIWKYRPGIVGITGSVGKTSTKLAIAAVLGSERKIRYSHGNFNNEIGLPLTILGDWTELRGIFFWPRVLFRSLLNLIRRTEYPEILILEYGADRPGDLRYLLSIARPNLSVITAVGGVPVHVEFYASPEEVAREKARLIEYLPVAGYAILNYDDETVLNMETRTRAHVITFGFDKNAEVRIMNFDHTCDDDRPVGISFKLKYGGNFVPVRLEGTFGKAQAYAAAAAGAVGLIFGFNLVKVSEALKSYRPADGRMQLLSGVKGTYILNDTYNASPLSVRAALETLDHLPGKRKIAVLGDMLEIGQYALEAHEEVGRLARKIADVIVTVGPRAKFIAEAALQSKFDKKNILSFDAADEAKRAVKDLMKKGDLVLVKASHGIHLEKVVEEIKVSGIMYQESGST